MVALTAATWTDWEQYEALVELGYDEADAFRRATSVQPVADDDEEGERDAA